MIKVIYMNGMRVIGDCEEVFSGENVSGWNVSNPHIIQYDQSGRPFLYPLLDQVVEKQVFVSVDKVEFPFLFEPLETLKNYYSENYGSGLQLTVN